MKTKTKMQGASALIIGISLLAFPLIGGAENTGSPKKAAGSTVNGDNKQTGAMSRVRGTVLSLREASVQGDQSKHLLGKVRMKNPNAANKTVVLDFGRVEDLKKRNISVQQNSEVKAEGRSGRINEQPVLFVHTFELVPVLMSEQERGSQSQTASQRSNATRGSGFRHILEGKISDMRDIDVEGISGKNRLFKLETTSGARVIVNAGAPSGLKELALESGDNVIVGGTMGRINDKSVIFADRIAEVTNVRGNQKQQAGG